MNLSYFALRRLILDAKRRLEGARIQGAGVSNRNAIFLETGVSGGSESRFLLSGSPTHGRAVFLESDVFKSDAAEQLDSPAWLERHILKSAIVRVEQDAYDRVIRLHLEKRDRIGGVSRTTLIAELMGRLSNVILTDSASGRIIALLRPHTSKTRPLQIGQPYTPPPPQRRTLPDQLEADTLAVLLSNSDRQVDESLAMSIAGLDRITAKEVLHRADIGTDPSSDRIADLLEEICHFYRDPPFEDGGYCILHPGGKPVDVTPFRCAHVPAERLQHYPSISEAIEAAFQSQLEEQSLKRTAKDLQRSLNRQLKTAETKRRRIADDIATARRADEFEKFGSLILAQLQKIPSGSDTVELDDLYGPGERIRIALDPKKSAVNNGKDYLKRASKARKSEPILVRRLAAAERDIVGIAGYSDRLNVVADQGALDEVRKELEARRLIRPQRQRSQLRRDDPHAIHPRRYLTGDGWEVWVGRNDLENDRMTKSAPKYDLFFHAQGCPGSHVILKRQSPNSEPTPTSLEDAACLAAYWSKARGARTVPVNYTEIRYVQKPRGAAPGLVRIRNEKTVFVEPRELRRTDNVEP